MRTFASLFSAVAEVAPPRGERGLKSINFVIYQGHKGRSPSWGAWIEMCLYRGLDLQAERSLPLVGSVD